MIQNTFEKSPENWVTYDYKSSIEKGGSNIFILAGHIREGYIWTDNTRWSIDDPDNSILPFLTYTNWSDKEQVDLRKTIVSVYLKGENLDLNGGSCHFWIYVGRRQYVETEKGIMCSDNATRWHLKQPIKITNDWKRFEFILKNDKKLWINSWNLVEKIPLDETLAHVSSYGFSFRNFDRQVTGKLMMKRFRIIEED